MVAGPLTGSPDSVEVASTLAAIEPVDPAWIERARARQKALTKPEGSLGRLEEVANRVAAIQQTLAPSLGKARIILFAADHGVAAEGVSAYPSSVTAEMVRNFLGGGAAICAIARANGIDLRVVDVGVASDLPESDGLVRLPIARGTGNIVREPAMSPESAAAAIAVGIRMVREAVSDGCGVVGIGEMGIGNTTTAAAVTVALTGHASSEVVGRGTGVDNRTLRKKVQVVARAAAFHRLPIADPIQILSRVGGFEIAAMCGVSIGAAATRTPVMVDGFIATAAAALACRMSASVGDYLFAAHRSPEAGHGILLDLIGHSPLLDLGMRLGEGTGAALGIAMLRSGVAAFTEMATFAEAGVSEAG